ncbi:hypothetical protein CF54_23865 [Streptomyces sp. Tu 6176]|nr:hypothetical protein CF54_23865 [Streptomyces sp. Tu 6176]
MGRGGRGAGRCGGRRGGARRADRRAARQQEAGGGQCEESPRAWCFHGKPSLPPARAAGTAPRVTCRKAAAGRSALTCNEASRRRTTQHLEPNEGRPRATFRRPAGLLLTEPATAEDSRRQQKR